MHKLKTLAATTAVAAFTATTLGTAAPVAAETFEIDAAHTDVAFMIMHLGYSNQFGRFNEMSGSFDFDEDNPEAASVNLTIQADSIDTGHAKRDEHLRSPDFLNAKEHPEITFESTDVAVTGETSGTLTGDLTMMGQTHPVTLDVTFNKVAPHPLPSYNNALTAGFSARGTIERSRWGVDAYVPNVGDEMKLFIEVEAMVPQDE